MPEKLFTSEDLGETLKMAIKVIAKGNADKVEVTSTGSIGPDDIQTIEANTSDETCKYSIKLGQFMDYWFPILIMVHADPILNPENKPGCVYAYRFSRLNGQFLSMDTADEQEWMLDNLDIEQIFVCPRDVSALSKQDPNYENPDGILVLAAGVMENGEVDDLQRAALIYEKLLKRADLTTQQRDQATAKMAECQA